LFALHNFSLRENEVKLVKRIIVSFGFSDFGNEKSCTFLSSSHDGYRSRFLSVFLLSFYSICFWSFGIVFAILSGRFFPSATLNNFHCSKFILVSWWNQ